MASIGTLVFTKLYGDLVGTDEFGNKYYRTKQGVETSHIGRGRGERRWVVYKGRAEPSKVPPYWHGWLHHVTDDIPIERDKTLLYPWSKPHLPNLTGTDLAYRPPGHVKAGGTREKATGDYEAWEPK